LVWYSFYDPFQALRLGVASILWGMGFAAVVITAAAIVHAVTGLAPLVDVRLVSLFGTLSAVGAIWKGRILYKTNWF